MSFRTVVLPALDLIDQIAGPNYLDIRTTQCSIITRTWTQGRIGLGGPSGYTDSTLTLPNYIRIRHIKEREVAQSGGFYEIGDVVVGPVRPPWTAFDGTTGGFTQAQLAPVGGPGIQIIHRLTQFLDTTDTTTTGIAGDYQLHNIRRDMSMRFMLYLTRKNTTPGP